ncbi:hypothetical protein M408DRAFT_181344 [Serendipita vermifera MAFF 305830]|uniref:Uncharacterized protein n=1 Tax=Serendipita vermifera MAFF 305830 TaxID=933852 RepID=A0A0C3APR1_SERVB|nr:hypothetical protein M408DRAFT_181344 [Serendipita vermifera MAFF 305830]
MYLDGLLTTASITRTRGCGPPSLSFPWLALLVTLKSKGFDRQTLLLCKNFSPWGRGERAVGRRMGHHLYGQDVEG